mmetsp:Transcript_22230/g.56083  ORF Transcript_22230/g.56083 Transcript_22230/m.56083 type:complete len:907 (-) Transcript_22230:285-3005(-)|eukprot:g14278.t1
MTSNIEQLKSDTSLLDYIQARQSQGQTEEQAKTDLVEFAKPRSSELSAKNSYPPASSSSNPPGGWNASTDTSGNRLSERRSSSTRQQSSSQYSADYTTVTTLASGKRPHLGLPLSQVERHDAISCHATGKRSSCATDDLIRIYVKFPLSGDRLAFWVHRELMLGGTLPQPAERNRFTEIFGEADEKENKSDALTEHAYLVHLMQQDSLKLRIEELTGIPVKDQKLWYNKIPLSNPIASLRRAGIGHGSELMIRCKTRVARRSMNSVDGTRLANAEQGGNSSTTTATQDEVESHVDRLSKNPQHGYRWYTQSGEQEIRRKSVQEHDTRVLDRISSASEKSQARQSAESHKRDSHTDENQSQPSPGDGGGGSVAKEGRNSGNSGSAGGRGSNGGRASTTITKDYDIDMNLLHKRVSNLPKHDAVFTNRSSTQYASRASGERDSRVSRLESQIGFSSGSGTEDASDKRDSARGRGSEASQARETTQESTASVLPGNNPSSFAPSSAFEEVFSRLSQKEKEHLREQFKHDLLRVERSSPVEPSSANTDQILSSNHYVQQSIFSGARETVQEDTIYETQEEYEEIDSDDVIPRLDDNARISMPEAVASGSSQPNVIPFSAGTNLQAAHNMMPNMKEKPPTLMNNGNNFLGKLTNFFAGSPTAAGSAAAEQEGTATSAGGGFDFASVTPSSPSLLVSSADAGGAPPAGAGHNNGNINLNTPAAEDDALSRYVQRHSSKASYNVQPQSPANLDVDLSANRKERRSSVVSGSGAAEVKPRRSSSSAMQKLILKNPGWSPMPPSSAGSDGGGAGGGGLPAPSRISDHILNTRTSAMSSQTQSQRRSSMTTNTKPFLIMPKMHFNPMPKLFEAPKIVYESPLYFDNFGTNQGYKDGGHGDAFARVREKVLGIPVLR